MAVPIGEVAGPIALAGQFGAQHLGDVALGDQLGFEVQAGRQVEVAVRRPREAVDAAVFAATVGVERTVEGMSGESFSLRTDLSVLEADFRLQRGQALGRLVLQRVPAIVEVVAHVALEAMLQPAGGTAALEGLEG